MIPQRPTFWLIQNTGLFYLMALVAIGFFLFGIYRLLPILLRGIKSNSIPFSSKRLLKLLLDGIFGRRIFKGDPAAGIMHLMISWGFTGLFLGTATLSIHHYVINFLKGDLYILYSVCLEIFGLILAAGSCWALIRRYLQRVRRLERRIADMIFPVWLLVICVSGFWIEGMRLAARQPEWAGMSFIGYGFSAYWGQDAAGYYPFFWWVHAVISLGFIAAIPYSKLLHSIMAPAGIYLQERAYPPFTSEVIHTDEDEFTFLEKISLLACTQCGRCVEVCPSASAGEPFSPRDVIMGTKKSLFGEIDFGNHFAALKTFGKSRKLKNSESNDITDWYCTTCLACFEACPVYVAPLDIIRENRKALLEEGIHVSEPLFQALENLYKYKNPLGISKKKRAEWSDELDICDISKKGNAKGFCYFVGCTTSMDARAQKLAFSFSQIMKHADVPFFILGEMEPCCGNIARWVGEDGLYEEQMTECLKLFAQYEIKELVTSSPHCFHTIRNEYDDGEDLVGNNGPVPGKIFHYSQMLKTMIADGTIVFDKPVPSKITYHDPCYLGRHNRIFSDPRDVVKAIPGVEFVEMAHHMENSLCCGSGGGRTWQGDLDRDVRMSDIRIQEAAATGADLVVTACPLCLLMLEDAAKTNGLENSLRVMDLNELVAMALKL